MKSLHALPHVLTKEIALSNYIISRRFTYQNKLYQRRNVLQEDENNNDIECGFYIIFHHF